MNCNTFKRDSLTAFEKGVLDGLVDLSLTFAFLSHLSKMYRLAKWKYLRKQQHFFFLLITLAEGGGGRGVSSVSSALKPMSACPVEDAGPNPDLGLPGATPSEGELLSRYKPVLKVVPRFKWLFGEAQTRGQQPWGWWPVPAPAQEHLGLTCTGGFIASPTPHVSPVLSQPLG